MSLALKNDFPPLREDAYGILRVADTRVSLASLVELYDQGASAEEIALSYEALDLHQVYSALGYYLGHRCALDAHLRAEREASGAARVEAQRRCPPTALRARLAARRRLDRASPAR